MSLNDLKKYSFLGLLSLGVNLLYTKMVLSPALLIRRPAHIRVLGSFSVGSGFTSGPGLILDVLSTSAKLVIGDNVKLNHRCHIGVMKSMKIGNDVLFASNVFISDHTHGSYAGENQSSPFQAPNAREIICQEVEIGDRVWIGENVAILMGVSIGESSIIGANSVVTKNIPAFSIAVGSPARVIKTWDQSTEQWVTVD
jgi:lipopolysaccharide O-acetyltransferase